MSSSEGSGSEAGSDFEPGAESEVSPVKPAAEKASSNKRSRNVKISGPNAPTTPGTQPGQSNTSKSPTAGSSNAIASTSQYPNPLQSGYLMPALGAGGIPIMLPGQGSMTNNERAHLYTFLRQLPLGFARADPSGAGLNTASLPFPFPMHPGLLAPANLSNEPIPSAHDAEAPPGGDNDSPGRSVSGSPSKARPEPGTVEWARQRKDNHKEVERRRRGNINEGINELARIIPNGQGDKAKGAVLARAVQYVRQMKENEQRTVEKWTMEKLMHDQAIVELQMKCNETEEKWKEEKTRREELEGEVTRLKKLLGETEEDELDEDEDEDDRPTKRQRVA